MKKIKILFICFIPILIITIFTSGAKASNDLQDIIPGKTTGFQYEEKTLNNYFSVYGFDGVSNYNCYRPDNSNSHTIINYATSFNVNDIPEIYLIINNQNTFSANTYNHYDKLNSDAYNYTDILRINDKDILFIDSDNLIFDYEGNESNSDIKALGIKCNSSSTISNRHMYKINLKEIFGENTIINNFSFRYIHMSNDWESYFSDSSSININDGSDESMTYKYAEKFDFIYEKFIDGVFDIYFPNVESNYNMAFFSLDNIYVENNNVYLKCINSFLDNNYIKAITIDNVKYDLIYDDNKKSYLINNLIMSGTKTYKINNIIVGTVEETAININQDFIYSVDEIYHECYVVSKWDQYNRFYNYYRNRFAMYNSLQGRLNNVVNFTVNLEQKEKYGFLWSKERWVNITRTFNIPDSTKYDNDFIKNIKYGQARKLNENERKIIDYSAFGIFEKLYLNLANIELAGTYCDYEFRIKGDSSDFRNLDFIKVVYKTEKNQIAFGSFYSGGLHIGLDGTTVYNGDGTVNNNYTTNENYQIVDKESNEVIHPDKQLVDELKKKNFNINDFLDVVTKENQNNLNKLIEFLNNLKANFITIKKGLIITGTTLIIAVGCACIIKYKRSRKK